MITFYPQTPSPFSAIEPLPSPSQINHQPYNPPAASRTRLHARLESGRRHLPVEDPTSGSSCCFAQIGGYVTTSTPHHGHHLPDNWHDTPRASSLSRLTHQTHYTSLSHHSTVTLPRLLPSYRLILICFPPTSLLSSCLSHSHPPVYLPLRPGLLLLPVWPAPCGYTN